MKKIIIFLVILLIVPLQSRAATYYIDYNAAGDAANGTSTDTPWKRCPGMVGFAGSYTHQAGDVFVFKGGVTWPNTVFPMSIGYSGESGSIDVYMGGQRCGKEGSAACNESSEWGSGYPVFDGEDTARFQSGLVTGARSYITIDGLKIIRAGDPSNGSGQGMLLAGGSYVTVKNNWLQPNGVNAFAYAPSSGTYTALYFHDNIIKQAGRVHIYVGGTAMVTDMRLYNNTMYGGYDYDPMAYHSDGFMIGGDGYEDYAIQGLYIYNNKFIGSWARYATAQLYLNGLSYYCYDYTNGSHEPTVGSVLIGETSVSQSKVWNYTNIGGWSGSGTGTICMSSSLILNGENLYETASYGGAYIGKVASSGVYAAEKSTKNVYIYNNLFATEHTTGKTFSPGVIDISLGHENIKIYNNTIDARSNTEMRPSHCIFFGAFVKDVDIQNNIMAGCDNGITLGATGTGAWSGTASIDANLFYTLNSDHLIWDNKVPSRWNTCAQIQAQGYGTTYCGIADPSITTEPSGIGSGDWHLAADSPARGNGVDLSGTFTTDLDAVTRVAWDIGAYEYVAPGADVTAPIISNLTPSGGQDYATTKQLSATTNEAANCRYHASSTTWGDMSAMSSTGGTTHTQTVNVATGANTFKIKCQDAAENESDAGTWSFTIADQAVPDFLVTISHTGAGTGTTDPVPGDHVYADDATATVTQTPNDTSTFAGWSGTCGCTGTGACAPTITADCTIIATYNLKAYSLTFSGCGSLNITSNPAGIACGETCTYNYDAYTLLEIESTVPWNRVVTYSGACEGHVCTTIDIGVANKAVACVLTLDQGELTGIGTGSGSLTVGGTGTMTLGN